MQTRLREQPNNLLWTNTDLFIELELLSRVIHLLRDLGRVEFDSDVPPYCPAAQPLLPNSHQPKQNWADGGTTKIKVNPTQISEQMNHQILAHKKHHIKHFQICQKTRQRKSLGPLLVVGIRGYFSCTWYDHILKEVRSADQWITFRTLRAPDQRARPLWGRRGRGGPTSPGSLSSSRRWNWTRTWHPRAVYISIRRSMDLR